VLNRIDPCNKLATQQSPHLRCFYEKHLNQCIDWWNSKRIFWASAAKSCMSQPEPTRMCWLRSKHITSPGICCTQFVELRNLQVVLHAAMAEVRVKVTVIVGFKVRVRSRFTNCAYMIFKLHSTTCKLHETYTWQCNNCIQSSSVHIQY